MKPEEQHFLDNPDKELWTAANKLLPMLDAAVYKHVVLGLIFLKYISDAFAQRRIELEAAFRDPENEYYLGEDADQDAAEQLEVRDHYTEKNVFWVPALARWDFLRDNAKVAEGAKLKVKNGKVANYQFRGIGRLIDDALLEVEKENPRLKGVLEKEFAIKRIDSALPSLIDQLSKIPFKHASLQAKDILGHVYEHFLGQFAIAEGKKGGQISIYGQESNPTTWRLASMNMAIRGMDFDFGSEPANSYARDLHPDLRANGSMSSNTNTEGETLFIDARKLGYMKDRVLRDFAEADIAKIAGAFHAWQKGEGYADEAGFCKSTALADLRKNDYVLTPGRYVGAADVEEDSEPFEEKMKRLTSTLFAQFDEGKKLEKAIRKNLAGLGYEEGQGGKG
jgi:type I restriction-modification system DNA methylase subunit